MKIVYIAGNFRGPTPWDVHQNVCAAERAAFEVAKLGAMPMCPHLNTKNFDKTLTDAFWLEGTMEMLRRCDAVFVFNPERSKTSTGTRAEVAEAERKGIPVWTDLDSLSAYVAMTTPRKS